MAEAPRVELAPGYSIAAIINGCWQITPDHGGGPASETEAMRRFDELIDAGFTTFDCADIYTGVEDLLGRFRRRLADPDRIQVHTKLVPDKSTLGALADRDIDRNIERSLRRLGVERLDLVQLHWWDYRVPGLQRLVNRLLEAQGAGRIRLLGVTNFDTARVGQLLAAGVPLATLQAQYSLLDRRPEKHMAALSAKAGLPLLAYGALAGGFLSARYLGAAAPAGRNRSLVKYRLMIDEAGGWSRFQGLLQVLDHIAGRHGVTPPAIAVRWVLDQPMTAAVILGVGTQSRVSDHLALCGLALSAEDSRDIEAALADLPVPPGDMYELERTEGGPHQAIIRTELNAMAQGGS